MEGYLLDTSTCVAMFRGNQNVAEKMNKVGVNKCFIFPIVVAELYFGAYRSGRAEEKLEQINRFVEVVQVLPFEDCLLTYAKERNRLWNIGEKIEDFDLLIGCAAKAAGLTIVTHNVKHFNHIEGLKIEDWVE